MLRLGSPRRRINIGLIGMTFVLTIFAGRLIQLQGLDSKVYEARADKQRLYTEVIEARRGSITDINGRAFATTVEAREIAIDPTVVGTDPNPKVAAEQRAKVAATLSSVLGIPRDPIIVSLARTNTRYQLVARGVDLDVADALVKQRVPGITMKKQYRRDYPVADLAGSLIGFVGVEGHGLEGLERAEEALLAGRGGERRIERGRFGQRIPMTASENHPPVDGESLRLTLDMDIQWAAQQAIAKKVKETGAESGTVIVMDVKTGGVLAMANTPEVDLKNWSRTPAANRRNLGVTDVFEPGSTNKVITAAAALESGKIGPGTVFTVRDNILCADRVLNDAHAHPPEQMAFEKIVATSSNVGTIMAARKVGDQKLHEMLQAFGFGARPGSGLPGEEAGLLPDYREWSGSQRCTIAYGQGISVTALQTASVYQTIANGGVRIQPRIVAGATNATGSFTRALPGKETKVVSKTTAGQITKMLEAAVGVEGTGALAAIPGYQVAGKTGTAYRYDAALGRYEGYTASFAGFAPANDPRLVVLVVVQKPAKEHYGGEIAAPVFKDVMTFAIKTKKIRPTVSDASAVATRTGQ